MGILEIALLGVGLAMDAVAVSMSNGMVYKNISFKWYAAMPLLFGIFQGIMPLIGFYAGTVFSDIITKYSGVVILIILGVIGGKMVIDSLRHKQDQEKQCRKITFGVLFFQAIATSIDAFAVGVGFCAIKVDIIPAVVLISVITAIMVIGAIAIGKVFGNMLESKAEMLGGIILIIIGIKAII